ncbi:unnamed protein product [Phyllotreta striolata]|uniref:Strictosidine synthase conserved region domain-containing protein n=1 Tax=Phyllotreta striolata TaxID=444603 RepID=A0A9N9XQ54_PHYSR|nr:unnamed protein product [Phyllotreta striolata]
MEFRKCFKQVFNFIFNRLLEYFLIVSVILFTPNLPPHTLFSKSISLPPTKPLTGTLALNSRLNNVEILYKNQLQGPETFATYNNDLYAGVSGGDIVMLTGKHIMHVAQTGKPCKAHYEEHICGRPLGMKFRKHGYLYVADAYFGILRILVDDGEKQVIVSPDQIIKGKKTKWFSGVSLASNGDIYWTASSTEFTLNNGLFELLSDPSGRLVHYNAATKINTVLIDNISAASGVALSDDEEFVVVSEPITSRIYRYYLKGPKNGTYDIFLEGLPGYPDNINSDNHGGFLVPLSYPINSNQINVAKYLLRFPWGRKIIARFLSITQWTFETLDKYLPNEISKFVIFTVGRIDPITSLMDSSRTSVLHVSKHGKILDSVHNTNGKIKGITEAFIFKKHLYLGFAQENYVAKIALSKLGWDNLA